MKTYIALLRGINVGGNRILPMADLRKLLESLKFQQVKTYIQSGNAVFQTRSTDKNKLSSTIAKAIEAQFGFLVPVLVLELTELERAINEVPFATKGLDPKTVHLFFLAASVKNPDLDSLEELKGKRERFELKQQVFYLLAPDGIARSKLATRLEKTLGVDATARNWRTICKIQELATKP